jgi:hypothetical protein
MAHSAQSRNLFGFLGWPFASGSVLGIEGAVNVAPRDHALRSKDDAIGQVNSRKKQSKGIIKAVSALPLRRFSASPTETRIAIDDGIGKGKFSQKINRFYFFGSAAVYFNTLLFLSKMCAAYSEIFSQNRKNLSPTTRQFVINLNGRHSYAEGHPQSLLKSLIQVELHITFRYGVSDSLTRPSISWSEIVPSDTPIIVLHTPEAFSASASQYAPTSILGVASLGTHTYPNASIASASRWAVSRSTMSDAAFKIKSRPVMSFQPEMILSQTGGSH